MATAAFRALLGVAHNHHHPTRKGPLCPRVAHQPTAFTLRHAHQSVRSGTVPRAPSRSYGAMLDGRCSQSTDNFAPRGHTYVVEGAPEQLFAMYAPHVASA